MWNTIVRRLKTCMALLCALMILAVITPTSRALYADDISGADAMLRTAVDRGEIIWRTVLETAFDTFPGDRRALLEAALAIAPDWLTAEEQAELEGYVAADEAAEAASRARGILYYLDPALWNGRADLGGTTSTGDTNERALNLTLHFDRQFGPRWSHVFDFSADLGRRQGVTTRERFVTDYALRYDLSDSLFLANSTRAEFDRFSGFDYRVSNVAGLGVKLLRDSKNHDLELQLGAGVRLNRLQSERLLPGDDNLTLTEFLGRAESIYNWAISDALALRNRTTAFLGTNSITLEDELSLSAAINSHLSARLTFIVNYESDAPVGSASVDTATRASLSYSF